MPFDSETREPRPEDQHVFVLMTLVQFDEYVSVVQDILEEYVHLASD